MPRRPIWPGCLGLVMAAVLLTGLSPAYAHGVGYGIEDGRRAVVVSVHYSTGKPMAYAQVLVFGPDGDRIEHQNGRTDSRGIFAFMPDKSGLWRVKVSDGRGHQLEVKTPVDLEAGTAPVGTEKTGSIPKGAMIVRAILGISLILNFGLLVHFFRKKRMAG